MKTGKQIMAALVALKLDGKLTPSTALFECDTRIIPSYEIWLEVERRVNPERKPSNEERLSKIFELVNRLNP